MDKRTIEAIEIYDKGLTLVQEIKPVTFRKKGQQQKLLGVIAQDLQALEPLCVDRSSQGVLSVDYESLLLLAVNAIKELKHEIDELKAINKAKKK